jgi:hypothetical protein
VTNQTKHRDARQDNRAEHRDRRDADDGEQVPLKPHTPHYNPTIKRLIAALPSVTPVKIMGR